MAFDLSKAAFGKTSVSNLDKIKMIPLEKILTNPGNFYSIEGIEELADSIEMVGLLSPVSVVPEATGYKLISGHRRFQAYRYLQQDDSKYNSIPAIVLSGLDDLTETIALITANSTTRELTYAEKCQQEKVLRDTLMAMKSIGVEIPRNLGQYIADQLGVSRNEVSRMHSVNENLSAEGKAKLEAGELTAQQAYEMSRKPAAEQVAELTPVLTDEADRDDRLHAAILSFIGENCTRLCAAAAEGGAAGIKRAFSGSGRSCSSGGWFAYGKLVELRSETAEQKKDVFAVGYQEIYKTLCRLALQQAALCPNPIFDDSANVDSAPVWHTGTPESDGQYVCRCRWRFGPNPEKAFARVLYLVNGRWTLDGSGATTVDDQADIVDWIKLPE